MEYLLEIKQKENGKDSKVKYKMLSAIREDGVKVFADEVEYQEDYFEEHTITVPSYYLKGTRSLNPKLIKDFVITSFKRAWDKKSLEFLPYRRNVANVWVDPWW